jgi:hypothetical protein
MESIQNQEPNDERALLETAINMYIACSYFVDRAKAKGKEERVIKEECLSFLATMIHKIKSEVSK